jgi:hypothetical protein
MLQGNDPGMVIGITVDVFVRKHSDNRGCQHIWTKRCSHGTLYNPHRRLHSIKRRCIFRVRPIHVSLKIIVLKSDYFAKGN